ncbi:MAG: KH domain-containing protein [Armatimonadota bacterium]
MKDLIEYLVRSLVDDPAQVNIAEIEGAESTTYEIRVASADLGKVIGKQGKIANALRTVAKAAAMRNKKRVYLEIIP